jgi:hypothetical protein
MDIYKVMLKEWGFLKKERKKTHFEGASSIKTYY